MASLWSEGLESERGNGAREDAGSGRDEALSRNPIRHRMELDRLPLAADDLTEMVARARDVFHSYVGQTIRRKYKRPPIYLVDRWVTDALGYFTTRSARLRPNEPTSFAHVVEFFRALGEVLGLIEGARLLHLREEADTLQRAAMAALKAPEAMDGLFDTLAVVRRVLRSAHAALGQDASVAPRVSSEYFRNFDQAGARLHEAARRYLEVGPPAIRGVSFEPGRHGGVLFQGIKELDIEGPAVVIAAANVLDWSRSMPVDRLPGNQAEARQAWFGARRPEHFPTAVALMNVVQHELTHAMLRLPNDPSDDESELRIAQEHLYAVTPGIEEGMANFVAGLATAHALMKVQLGLRGADVVPLTTRKHPQAFAALKPIVDWTYADYHRAATDDYFEAWEKNGRDFKAFGGLFALFATHMGANDWSRTQAALAEGTIATTTKERK